MSFLATVYRVFIASPSDVEEEREELCRIIYQWNAVNACETGIMLDPVKYESHASPQAGDRGQALINKQLLIESDLLIGIFWTKFGSPTGSFGSGTEEEIEEFMKLHKPLMLYFSDMLIPPSKINDRQHKKVRDYRKKYESRGLYDTYDNLSDFRKKISNHLSLTIQEYFLKPTHLHTGIESTHARSSGRVTPDFILSRGELMIFLKDGFTFFDKLSGPLLERFRRPALRTKIMIVHPDYEYIGAVAGMDSGKKEKPDVQRDECIAVIRLLQQLRKQVRKELGEDIAKRIVFQGYRAVPTWNGFISEKDAIIHLYPTVSYRGNLQTLEISAKGKDGQDTDWYRYYKEEFEQLEREHAKNARNDLWKF